MVYPVHLLLDGISHLMKRIRKFFNHLVICVKLNKYILSIMLDLDTNNNVLGYLRTVHFSENKNQDKVQN